MCQAGYALVCKYGFEDCTKPRMPGNRTRDSLRTRTSSWISNPSFLVGVANLVPLDENAQQRGTPPMKTSFVFVRVDTSHI